MYKANINLYIKIMKESPERKGKFRSDSDKKSRVCPLKGNDQWLE